jgi:hypothetical protein
MGLACWVGGCSHQPEFAWRAAWARLLLTPAARRYPVNTPRTKEAYFYRSIFESFFPQPAAAETVPGALRCAVGPGVVLLGARVWVCMHACVHGKRGALLGLAARPRVAARARDTRRAACALMFAGGPSVACSTATAALWDAAWAGKEDPSGRAVAVHDDAYKS